MGKIENCIAISGKFCSGKDTLARHLIQMDPRYRKVALADILKQRVAEACDVTVEYIDQNKADFRDLLQVYGTNTMRGVHGQDVWVNLLVEYCVASGFNYVIVTDVRFPNEYRGLYKAAQHFYGIRLEVSGEVQRTRYFNHYGVMPAAAQLSHDSETVFDNIRFAFNMVVCNDLLPEEHLAYAACRALRKSTLDFQGELVNASAA